MKLLFLTNIPSPYRVDFFNELGKYCELTVLFEKMESDERDVSWRKFNSDNFNAIFLKGIRVGVAEAFCPNVIQYLKKNQYDHIIVTNFSDLTGMMAIVYMKLKKVPFGVESDGGFAGSGRGLKEKIKKYILSGSSFYFSTSDEHDKYYLTYGAEKDEIIRYPFTSIHDSDILSTPVSLEEKKTLRKKIGMKEEKIILSVGQFIYRKGYDVLFESLSNMSRTVGCYIVGGKPTEEYLQVVKDKKLNNVHFVDFKNKYELEEYYKAADVFVLPTREDIWGLVINEAMAKGLPVVTTDRCIAGLELIGERPIGRIVPANDINALSKAISDEMIEIDYNKGIEVLKRIRKYSIEMMATVHINVLGKD